MRLTGLAAANETGVKLYMSIAGKYEQMRYFKNIKATCISEKAISIYIIRAAEQWESLCSQAKILNLHLRLILKMNKRHKPLELYFL